MAESSRTSEQNLLIQARLDKQAARKQVIGRIVPYFGLVFLFIFFTIVTKGLFISKKNLTNMVEQCFTMCIVATGAAFVYAQGNMDFSIGSACGVAQMCGAILLLHKGWPMPLAMAVTILVPVLTCSLVSTIAVVFRVPVFIGSMCVRSLLAGLLTIGVAKAEIVIPVSNWPIMTNGVFKAAVMLAIIAVGVYLFHFTGWENGPRPSAATAIPQSRRALRSSSSSTWPIFFWASAWALQVCSRCFAIPRSPPQPEPASSLISCWQWSWAASPCPAAIRPTCLPQSWVPSRRRF